MTHRDIPIHRPTGNGTTHKIREQLNFLDNKRWKQFSSRRLELIDKFGLHEKMASVQDINIKRIANVLRTEYNYPNDFQLDFEKLVTAAVQSVRRNRKRSIKTKNGTSIDGVTSSNNNQYDNLLSAEPSPTATSVSSPTSSSKNASRNNSFLHELEYNPITNSDNNSNGDATTTTGINPVMPQKPIEKIAVKSVTPHMSFSGSKVKQQPILTSIEIVKQIISDMVNMRIPIKEQEKKETMLQYSSPMSSNTSPLSTGIATTTTTTAATTPHSSIKSTTPTTMNGFESSNTNPFNSSPMEFFALTSQNRDLLPLALEQQKKINEKTIGNSGSNRNTETKYTIPFFLKEKTLSQINRSKTCLEISSQQGSFIDLYPNILFLGNTLVQSSVSFVIERFYSHIPISSIEYLMNKMIYNNDEVLSKLSQQFFNNATHHNVDNLPIVYQIHLFKIIFGSLCKDFGFDPVIYPLSEIFTDYILKEFPLITSSSSASSSLFNPMANNGSAANSAHPSFPGSHTSMVLNTVSLKPSVANQDIYRKVVIGYKEKVQEFTFHLLSNGPPTISEILNNCKNLFKINSMANLQLYHNVADTASVLIRDDMELASIFNQFTLTKTYIEIKEFTSASATTTGPAQGPLDGKMGDSLNGLSILSSAATSVNYENKISPTNSCSTTGLISKIHDPLQQEHKIFKKETDLQDNLRNKLNDSPPPDIKKCSGLFLNNSLPKPLNEFQPLLQ